MRNLKLIPRYMLLLLVLCVAVFALSPAASSTDIRGASLRINEDPDVVVDSAIIVDGWPWTEDPDSDRKGKSDGDTQPVRDEQIEGDQSSPVRPSGTTVEAIFLNWYLPLLQ